MENPRAAQVRSEHRLAVFYFLAAAFSIIGLICTAVVFGYWHFTLDECDGHPGLDKRHCGCLLFARSSYRLFIGGDTPVCHYVEFSCIPGIVIGLLMGFFHWYRASFTLKKPPKIKRRRHHIVNSQDAVVSRHSFGKVMVAEKPSTAAMLWWLSAALLAGVLALLTLTSAVTLTAGVAQACQQYRENLLESLSADGYLAALITERLSCQAVFDFMDFLQPIKERHSANFINTGVALHFAIFALWLCAVAWVAATLGSVFEALRSRACCSCCCASSSAASNRR